VASMVTARFPSLTYARAETRRTLRDRLAAYLHSPRNAVARIDSEVMLDDIDMLQLLEGLERTEGNDIESAQLRGQTESLSEIRLCNCMSDLLSITYLKQQIL
jgi:hypothetical protein